MRRTKRYLTASVAAFCVVLTIVLVTALRERSHPKASFDFPYRGFSVSAMRFSPDGQNLGLVTNETEFGGRWANFCTRVYRVADGKVVHEIQDGSWTCAWNRNGGILAVASLDGEEYDLWDTRTWMRKRKLSLGFSRADKEAKTLLDTKILDLCFDHQGNLYAVVFADTDMGGMIAPFDRAKVWWDATSAKGQVKAEQIGTCEAPFDLSVASLGLDTRLAVSCMAGKPLVEILRVSKDSHGKRIVKREYEVTDLGAHESYVNPILRLTADGKSLVVRTTARCRVFQLLDDHAKLICSRDDQLDPSAMAKLLGNVLDVSLDGQVAAYSSNGRAEVIRLPAGELLLEIGEEPCRLALSPDGGLLAVAGRQPNRISFYRIPH